MTLYIIATPIGNLKDFTFRALETLQHCDYLLCEDTRVSQKLLNHYDIKKKLVSFHKFNEKRGETKVIEDLKAGATLGLLSDAGTPCVADPGQQLVQKCRQDGITVVALPGPSSITCALVGSGFPTIPFQFLGFFPKKEGGQKKMVEQIVAFSGTSLCFETKHRIEKILHRIAIWEPELFIGCGRELTKKFEEFLFGSAKQLVLHFKEKPPKGEFVLLFNPLYKL